MGDQYTRSIYNMIQSWQPYSDGDSWPTASMEIVDELLLNLKQSNASTITNAMQLFSTNSPNGPIQNMNMNDVKENNAYRASQNDSNKASFLNRYLYLILKILFFIIVFAVLYYKLRYNFTNASTNIGSQMETIQKKATNVLENLTPK